MKREQVAKKARRELQGLFLRWNRLLAGGGLILYLGRAGSGVPPVKETTRLWIDAAWRMHDGHSVLAACLDEPKRVLTALVEIKGLPVDSVMLEGVPGDIVIHFQGGIVVESFGRDTEGEQWEVRRSDGYRLGLGEHWQFHEEFVKPD